MGTVAKIQGESIPFSIDLAELGVIDSVTFEIYRSSKKNIIYQFKYPATSGYETVTKTGNTYTFELTSAQTLEMSGSYGIELTYTSGTSTYKTQAEGLIISKEAS